MQGRVIDAGRVGTLLDGVRRYAASADLNSAGEAATIGSIVPTGGVSAEGRVERAADALLDLLKEDTPASKIVTEQLVLVLGAQSRTLWADLRDRSGQLGEQRSLLGTLVDPLGVFRNSPLINADDRDRAALEAATKLVDLADEILKESLLAESEPLGTNELVQALAAKAWERRADLQVVSRRIAVEALDQAANRLVPASK